MELTKVYLLLFLAFAAAIVASKAAAPVTVSEYLQGDTIVCLHGVDQARREIESVTADFIELVNRNRSRTPLLSSLAEPEVQEELLPEILEILQLQISVPEAKILLMEQLDRMRANKRKIIDSRRIDFWDRTSFIAELKDHPHAGYIYDAAGDRIAYQSRKAKDPRTGLVPVLVILNERTPDEIASRLRTFSDLENNVLQAESVGNTLLALRAYVLTLYTNEKGGPQSPRWFFEGIANYIGFLQVSKLVGDNEAIKSFRSIFPQPSPHVTARLADWKWDDDRHAISAESLSYSAASANVIFTLVNRFQPAGLAKMLRHLASKPGPIGPAEIDSALSSVFGKDVTAVTLLK